MESIIKSKTEDELKKIAIDLADGKIFCDLHIDEKDVVTLGMVFMPVVLMASDELLKEAENGNLGLIYEYMDQAGPRSVNGYPIFFSMQLLNKEDNIKMANYYEQYLNLKKNFLK